MSVRGTLNGSGFYHHETSEKIRALAAAGMTKNAIATQLNVSERSVYRALSGAEEA